MGSTSMFSRRNDSMRDGLSPKGRVEIFATIGKPEIVHGPVLYRKGNKTIYQSAELDFDKTPVVYRDECYNILVNNGKDRAISALVSGAVETIERMAIGDRGALPSNPQQTKIPVATMSSLYNEIYRADVDTRVLEIGTPDLHQAKFIKTFSAVDVPITAFSNQAQPIINEVGLITYDETILPHPRLPVAAPNLHLPDEKLFSIRTFKSVPFEAANEISVTIRYTIFIE